MTGPAAPRPPLPRGVRFAAAVAFLLSAVTGFFTLNEFAELGHLSELRSASGSQPFSVVGDPKLDAPIAQAWFSALEAMRESRSLILGALLVAYALVFVSAGRMLRPEGIRLEGVRRLLGGSAIAVALLRTIDGAQLSVVASRMGPALANAMRAVSGAQGPEAEAFESAASLVTLSVALFTALIAGTFALLGQYFRGERVRLAVLQQDASLAEEDE